MEYYQHLGKICDKLDINNIITNDIDAWQENKKHKKIYNKLWLVEQQKVPCGPIGTDVNKFPIIIKPIINLYGMSKGFMIINDEDTYYKNQNEGTFWMPYLKGKNYTIDLILDKGKIVGVYALESKPFYSGTFEYHVYRPNYKLSDKIIKLIEKNFKSYSGPMNIEVINDIIIEGHLRLNGDLYCYNDDFFINLSNLIDGKPYELKVKKKKFYLFPYFVPGNFNLNILDVDEIENILKDNGVFNIRWDNIKSDYQRKDLTRLLMYKVNTLKKGNLIKNLIKKNLYLREKIYKVL